MREKTNVLRVTHVGEDFRVDTDEDTLRAKHVIWTAGEYQYPELGGFPGAELCRHTATIGAYADLEEDEFVVIGGYESGIDAAYHLSLYGKDVSLLDRGCPWEAQTSDPSVALSPYSLVRMRTQSFHEHVDLYPHSEALSVTRTEEGYEVLMPRDEYIETKAPPLLAGGFRGSHQLVKDLFERRQDGFPLVTENDESSITPGLFLCGPSLRHGNHVFCFIYKYRQRFAVVAKAIATSLGREAKALETYRKWGMYLDDLSDCGEECIC